MGFSNKDDHRDHRDYEADMYTGITTFHGLVRIYNSKHWWSRGFWITLSFTAMSLFFAQSYLTLQYYNQKPTIVQSDFHVPPSGIVFPDITICNMNPVDYIKAADKYDKYGLDDDTLKYIMYSYLQAENLHTQIESSTFYRLHNAYKNFTRRFNDSYGAEFNLRIFFRETGYSCDGMIKSCMFSGLVIEDCCSNSKPILTDIGLCHKFKGFGPANQTIFQTQRLSGAFYGLHMTIDVQTNHYPTIYVENFVDAGVKFFVHEDGIIPMLSSMGSAVPPGHKGFGAVTLDRYDFLPKDNWGNCIDHYPTAVGNFHYSAEQEGEYHSSNCEAKCIAESFRRNCSCVPMRYQFDEKSNYTVCTPMDMFKCINKTRETKNYWFKDCECEIECQRNAYNLEMSFSAYPTKPAAEYLARFHHEHVEYIRDNYLTLNVYMKQIIERNYTQQQQLSKTSVLSDIGGNMGMFLGMSVITLGEIFIFFVKCAWGTAHRRRRQDLVRRDQVMSDEEQEEQRGVKKLNIVITEAPPSPNPSRKYGGPDRFQTVYSEVDKKRKRSIVPFGTKAQETTTLSALDTEKWLQKHLKAAGSGTKQND